MCLRENDELDVPWNDTTLNIGSTPKKGRGTFYWYAKPLNFTVPDDTWAIVVDLCCRLCQNRRRRAWLRGLEINKIQSYELLNIESITNFIPVAYLTARKRVGWIIWRLKRKIKDNGEEEILILINIIFFYPVFVCVCDNIF